MREIFFDIKGVILHSHISVMNFIRTSFICILSSLFFTAKAQYISVDSNRYNAEQLVKQIFFGNQSTSCIEVENVSAKGFTFADSDKSFGYFNRNGSDFEMDEGILLTTGSLKQAIGPNNSIISSSDPSWAGDTDLENGLDIQDTHNATILEFDFTVNNTNHVSFDYLFASEQYLIDGTVSQCKYTDGFAFLIKEAGTANPYRNLAVIPGTDTPIRSNTVRGSGSNICSAINEAYFGQYNETESPTNFNGQTKILTAATEVIPGVKYHIKLVIADQGNGFYDSAVFLKAGSFVGKKDLGPDRLIAQNNALCEDTSLMLNAEIPGATYQWFRNGTALTGENAATYNVTSAGVYEVEINTNSCLLRGAVQIEYAAKPVAASKSYCNYNNGKPITVNLQSYNRDLISNYQPYFKVTYENASGEVLPDNFSYTNDLTIYAKVQSGNCETVTVPVELRTPVASTILQDQTICAGSTTRLQTENTFIYYKWMRENGEIISEGNNTYFIDDVQVGKYTVELTSTNGCKLHQDVIVSTIALPVITYIEVSGNTATVFVSSGQTPYEYSLDGVNFQSSNLFAGLQRGMHTVYIRDMMQCSIVSKEFLIINLINILTPNADGKNDLLDYTDLKIKENVSIKIFDRSGTIVYTSKPTDFTWDGKLNGRPLATGTYWYVLSWTEPFTQLPVNYKGWILLKNRN